MQYANEYVHISLVANIHVLCTFRNVISIVSASAGKGLQMTGGAIEFSYAIFENVIASHHKSQISTVFPTNKLISNLILANFRHSAVFQQKLSVEIIFHCEM